MKTKTRHIDRKNARRIKTRTRETNRNSGGARRSVCGMRMWGLVIVGVVATRSDRIHAGLGVRVLVIHMQWCGNRICFVLRFSRGFSTCCCFFFPMFFSFKFFYVTYDEGFVWYVYVQAGENEEAFGWKLLMSVIMYVCF